MVSSKRVDSMSTRIRFNVFLVKFISSIKKFFNGFLFFFSCSTFDDPNIEPLRSINSFKSLWIFISIFLLFFSSLPDTLIKTPIDNFMKIYLNSLILWSFITNKGFNTKESNAIMTALKDIKAFMKNNVSKKLELINIIRIFKLITIKIMYFEKCFLILFSFFFVQI